MSIKTHCLQTVNIRWLILGLNMKHEIDLHTDRSTDRTIYRQIYLPTDRSTDRSIYRVVHPERSTLEFNFFPDYQTETRI